MHVIFCLNHDIMVIRSQEYYYDVFEKSLFVTIIPIAQCTYIYTYIYGSLLPELISIFAMYLPVFAVW